MKRNLTAVALYTQGMKQIAHSDSSFKCRLDCAANRLRREKAQTRLKSKIRSSIICALSLSTNAQPQYFQVCFTKIVHAPDLQLVRARDPISNNRHRNPFPWYRIRFSEIELYRTGVYVRCDDFVQDAETFWEDLQDAGGWNSGI